MAVEVVESVGSRWRSRPGLSLAVRAVVFVVPIAAGALAATIVAHALPRPDGMLQRAGWWASVLIASTLTVLLAERLARRLLPLAMLLRLTLIFPARAPSRFAVALRAGALRNLEERVHEAKVHGVHDEPAQAAETVLMLAAALTAHDRWTRGHCERVRAFTDLLADELDLSADERDRLRWASLLHDIGKLAVSTRILNKPGDPDEDEWTAIHRHPIEGARLAAPLVPWLGDWAHAIEQHHERFDGTGYPHRLQGEDISLAARIVSVADAYDTMTSVRPYKRPMPVLTAREELVRCAGSHFDPAVVRAFLCLSIQRLRWTVGPLAWIVALPFVARALRAGEESARLGEQLIVATKTVAGVTTLAVAGSITLPPSPVGPEPAIASVAEVSPATTPVLAPSFPAFVPPAVLPTPSSAPAPGSSDAPPAAAAEAPPSPSAGGGAPVPAVTSSEAPPAPAPAPAATPAAAGAPKAPATASASPSSPPPQAPTPAPAPKPAAATPAKSPAPAPAPAPGSPKPASTDGDDVDDDDVEQDDDCDNNGVRRRARGNPGPAPHGVKRGQADSLADDCKVSGLSRSATNADD